MLSLELFQLEKGTFRKANPVKLLSMGGYV